MEHQNENQFELFKKSKIKILSKEDVIDQVQELYMAGISDAQIIGAFIDHIQLEKISAVLDDLRNRFRL